MAAFSNSAKGKSDWSWLTIGVSCDWFIILHEDDLVMAKCRKWSFNIGVRSRPCIMYYHPSTIRAWIKCHVCVWNCLLSHVYKRDGSNDPPPVDMGEYDELPQPNIAAVSSDHEYKGWVTKSLPTYGYPTASVKCIFLFQQISIEHPAGFNRSREQPINKNPLNPSTVST